MGGGRVDSVKIGCVPQTLLGWVNRHEVDSGSAMASRRLSQAGQGTRTQVKELRRTNEILKLASAFFAQAELDRRLKF